MEVIRRNLSLKMIHYLKDVSVETVGAIEEHKLLTGHNWRGPFLKGGCGFWGSMTDPGRCQIREDIGYGLLTSERGLLCQTRMLTLDLRDWRDLKAWKPKRECRCWVKDNVGFEVCQLKDDVRAVSDRSWRLKDWDLELKVEARAGVWSIDGIRFWSWWSVGNWGEKKWCNFRRGANATV